MTYNVFGRMLNLIQLQLQQHCCEYCKSCLCHLFIFLLSIFHFCAILTGIGFKVSHILKKFYLYYICKNVIRWSS